MIARQPAPKPLVSVVVPAWNEAPIVEKHLATLYAFMKSLEDEYRWELIFINDGSADDTGDLAEAFSKTRENIHVLHHRVNAGLGRALQSAFRQCRGDYIVTLDLDLSYSADHISELLRRIRDTGAKVVVASPYMKGGTVSNVPWLRWTLSKWANRFLSMSVRGRVSTLTGMVRIYDGRFLKALNLRASGKEINPEILFKAMLLDAKIEEVPAHLNWQPRKAEKMRRAHMNALRYTTSILVSGFLFRPVMFFMLPGLALLAFSLYVNTWGLIHFFRHYQTFHQYAWFPSRASAAAAAAYAQAPHTVVVGLLSLTLAIQLIGLGILALQSKSYFEEMFHLVLSASGVVREEKSDVA